MGAYPSCPLYLLGARVGFRVGTCLLTAHSVLTDSSRAVRFGSVRFGSVRFVRECSRDVLCSGPTQRRSEQPSRSNPCASRFSSSSMSYLASQDSISWYVQGASALASRYADRSLVRSAPWQVMVLAGEVFVTGSLSHALEPNAPTKQVVGFSIIFCGMVRARQYIPRDMSTLAHELRVRVRMRVSTTGCAGGGSGNQASPRRGEDRV